MSTQLYTVAFRSGYYAVVKHGTWETVEEHRTYNAAKHGVLRLTAAATQRPRPELDDLVRADEEAAGPGR